MIQISEIFPWDDNFGTGIEIIDEQHKKLVMLVNKLAMKIATDSGELTINQVLDELTDYTIYHFDSEEKIWLQYLPVDTLTTTHQETHRDFVDEISKAKGELGNLSNIEIIDDVLSFLTHWLAFHILDTDRHMAKIIMAVQQGMTAEQAKSHAADEMSGGTRLLVEAILKMYDSLSSRTLDLIREIAQRQRAEQKLQLSKNVIDSSMEAIFITDADGLIIDANPAFCSDVAIDPAQLAGRDIRSIKPSLFNSREDGTDTWSLARDNGHWGGEVVLINGQGDSEAVWLTLSTVRDAQENIENFAGVLTSISQLIQRQHVLELEVNHDRLTGLPNRRLLEDRLKLAIAHHARNKRLLAVCFIDLDGFKAVNDTLGHDAGDELLRVVSRRLSDLLRSEDTVARLGGDEFVILLGDLVSKEDIEPLLGRILNTIEQPIPIGPDEAHVSASIGVTL